MKSSKDVKPIAGMTLRHVSGWTQKIEQVGANGRIIVDNGEVFAGNGGGGAWDVGLFEIISEPAPAPEAGKREWKKGDVVWAKATVIGKGSANACQLDFGLLLTGYLPPDMLHASPETAPASNSAEVARLKAENEQLKLAAAQQGIDKDRFRRMIQRDHDASAGEWIRDNNQLRDDLSRAKRDLELMTRERNEWRDKAKRIGRI